jgi:hypothetical protein
VLKETPVWVEHDMQAVCDSKNRFIDVSIGHPAATSDWLALKTSSLITLLETPGFLANGVCIYGDNAYVSNEYMVTPFKGATGGPEDDLLKKNKILSISASNQNRVQLWNTRA